MSDRIHSAVGPGVLAALAALLVGAAAPAPEPSPRPRPSCPAPAVVKPEGARAWRLPREALRVFHARRDCLRALGRAVPVEEAGKPRGLALRNIPKGGFVEALGLRDGDVLLQVAGLPVHSTELALAAYALVLVSSSAEVVLEREGAERRHRYTLTD